MQGPRGFRSRGTDGFIRESRDDIGIPSAPRGPLPPRGPYELDCCGCCMGVICIFILIIGVILVSIF